jgi:uncharacterized protein involved in exopolysaccharide biosynthesis
MDSTTETTAPPHRNVLLALFCGFVWGLALGVYLASLWS